LSIDKHETAATRTKQKRRHPLDTGYGSEVSSISSSSNAASVGEADIGALRFGMWPYVRLTTSSPVQASSPRHFAFSNMSFEAGSYNDVTSAADAYGHRVPTHERDSGRRRPAGRTTGSQRCDASNARTNHQRPMTVDPIRDTIVHHTRGIFTDQVVLDIGANGSNMMNIVSENVLPSVEMHRSRALQPALVSQLPKYALESDL
jgi:hypothetical protein